MEPSQIQPANTRLDTISEHVSVGRNNQSIRSARLAKSAEKIASRNMTRMVLAMGIFYTIGYTPYTISFIIIKVSQYIHGMFNHDFAFNINTITRFFLVTAHSSYIFIFVKYINTFRNALRETFKFKFKNRNN
jgi:hypothetical protein